MTYSQENVDKLLDAVTWLIDEMDSAGETRWWDGEDDDPPLFDCVAATVQAVRKFRPNFYQHWAQDIEDYENDKIQHSHEVSELPLDVLGDTGQ